MKARLLTFVALLLGLVACQTDPVGLDVTLGEGVESVITVALPDATRGDSAEGGLGNITLGEQYSLRYILEIYAVDEDKKAITTSCQRHIKVANTTSVAFPVRLAPGYDYQFAVWADFVEKDSDGSDRYYKTTDGDKSFGLYALTIIENDETKWNAMDETRDAFTASELICNFSSASTITLNLEHGIDYDAEYEAALKSVTPEDVKTLMQAVLAQNNFIQFLVKKTFAEIAGEIHEKLLS
mgnify:CR=1 FL=1